MQYEGWVLIGEVAKLVPISDDRIVSIHTAASGGLSVVIKGAQEESVQLLAAKLDGSIQAASAVVGVDGSA